PPANTAVYSWYNNDENNAETLGGLYNWYAIETQKLCPCGWRVPSDNDWEELRTFLDPYAGVNTDDAGGQMKATILWEEPNTGATNSSGFGGLPGGFRSNGGTFSFFGERGYWWSSTENSYNFAWSRSLQNNSTSVPRNNSGKGFGNSVRCIKNAE
ncbi:MAG: fibrobacter succinogenes major paralogous domain-containing protein, partial [Cryomorphaceae bacterium]